MSYCVSPSCSYKSTELQNLGCGYAFHCQYVVNTLKGKRSSSGQYEQ